MDAYVGVTNDVSVAVKSILQIKKAFRTQMKCIEDLSQTNESLQQTIRKREDENKELQAVVALFLQNEEIDGNYKHTDKHCLSLSRSKEQGKDVIETVNTSSKWKDSSFCPTSPTSLNGQGNKRKCTPSKPTQLRKSRRISTRK